MRYLCAAMAMAGLLASGTARSEARISYGTLGEAGLKPSARAPQGCIAGTVGARGAPDAIKATGIRLVFQRAEDTGTRKRQVTIQFKFDPEKADYQDGIEAGDAFVVCLKPGRYVLSGIAESISARVFTETLSTTAPLETGFDLSEGQWLYLGNFVTNPFEALRNDCHPGTPGARFHLDIKDRMVRDEPLIRAARTTGDASAPLIRSIVTQSPPFLLHCTAAA